MEKVFAIVLAGGSGTRLWPLSRTLLPKQLLSLNGDLSLLQQTVSRILNLLPPEKIFVITNEEHVFEVRSQLKDLNPALDTQVLSEPVGKNTLPAILLGLDKVLEQEEEPIIGVFPSDHQIQDEKAWLQDMQVAFEIARDGWFVTFGIKPYKPETGYGYIEVGEEIKEGAFKVKAFVEKPDLATAKEYLQQGTYYWNSGMFMFPGVGLVQAVETWQPELNKWWQKRKEKPLVEGYGKIPDISVDYGIMEKVDSAAVVPADFGWDDLGNWEALYRLGPKDDNGCVINGDVLPLDCRDSLLFSTGGKLAAIGLKDMIVVQTRDATLICPRQEVQKVKNVVSILKSQDSQLVEAHVTVNRPWGSYTVLEEGRFYKIKRIKVKPGAKLSLQMHYHRSEHWVVIKGTAEVVVGDKTILLCENQSVDIPRTTRHRLANPGKVPVEIIEIQSGPYLEEDDIVRFDDVYGRHEKNTS